MAVIDLKPENIVVEPNSSLRPTAKSENVAVWEFLKEREDARQNKDELDVTNRSEKT